MYKPMASFFDNKNYLTSGSGDFANNMGGMSLSEYGGGRKENYSQFIISNLLT